MRKFITLLALVNLCYSVAAQISVTPFVGINSTKMNDGDYFENGGAFGLAGVEIELRRKSKQDKPVYLTVATGVSYLSNGFYHSSNFSYTALDFYTQRISDLRMQYWQVPFVVRLNWQPFPLVEDWKIFAGLGVCNNFLTESTLKEKYTEVFINADPLAPPDVSSYNDARDITDYGKKSSLFRRIELGMKYKRFQLSYRLSKSLVDLYHTGLEDDWNVPDDKSWYIDSHQSSGKTIEKYSELVLGFRFGE
jgi:hypothetical protein